MVVVYFFEDLSQDFTQLLNESNDYNIIIQAGKEPDFKEFKAHSIILCARSSYFKNIIYNKLATNKSDPIVHLKTDISPNIFNVILRYTYTGALDLTNQTGCDLIALLVAAEELIIAQLIYYVQKYIIDNESSWLLTNLVNVLHTVFKLQSCNIIQDFIMDIIYLVAYLMANAKPQYSKLLPRHGNVYIDSDIIESEHSVIISSWIEKKFEKLSCKFILAYRGTRDGFDSNISYYMCETIIAILVLIKIKDSNKIIGGYNPLGWNLISHGYYGSDCFEDACFEEEHWASANDSFIFCFDENSNTHTLSHVENPEKAIYNNSCADESWLNFGGGDLVLKDQRGTCSKCNYEKTILEDYIFIAEEVEIFQVQMPKVQKKSHNMEIERKSKRAKLSR
ncbi:BTB-domain-containing protein [Gigaspora margarita]|uniref:BTB-domain-containing protein n=1 Tax=Gigaspora margarita TaxID=4874 RepID=A0A8H3XDW4_GIGMA|nr:BTB-domain-containing protein [Gigaspora margarita]